MELAAFDLVALGLALLAAGALTGVLAGLFGVGGGGLIVPVLFEAFGFLGIDEAARMPLAVGTSLAIIIPTSIRSFLSHRARGTVDEGLLRAWALPILLGVGTGAALARYAPPALFQGVFVLVAGTNAVKLLTGASLASAARQLPTGLLLQAYGTLIGLLSALMGIGGGVISTTVMTLYGRPILQAVATSSGIGVLISVPGALGYVLAGLGREGLPPDAVGYVSLLGALLFIPSTVLTATLGVRLAHFLTRRALEIAFGTFLALVSLRFLYLMLFG